MHDSNDMDIFLTLISYNACAHIVLQNKIKVQVIAKE